MKELVTQIDIEATPEHVWEILTDFEHYEEWNPFICQAKGKVAAGEHVDIHVRPLGPKVKTLHCTIVEVETGHELRWKWHVLSPALYSGEHTFRIEPIDAEHVRFVDDEVFNGWLLPLYAKGIDSNSKRGFEAMDKALKARAEHKER